MRVIIIICHWFQPLEDYQPGLERGRWAEPAVQKWVSCFHHSRPFPTTSTTSTTACWHGELHLTRRAPSHHDGLLTRRAPSHTESSISPRRPANTESSISPWRPADAPLHHSLTTTATGYRHWPVLCVELPAARYAQKTHTPISRTTAFSRTSSVRLEWRTDWIDCGRSLFTPCSWLRRNKYKNKQTKTKNHR